MTAVTEKTAKDSAGLKEEEIAKAKEVAKGVVADAKAKEDAKEDAKEVAADAKAEEETKEAEAEDDAVDAKDLLAQGKRNMLCGEMPEAVTQLQEACRLLAKKHGETADECGEAYLAYGSALLDLSRMESGVLGNALEGAHMDSADDSADEKTTEDDESEKMTEEEREKISDQVIDAMTEDRPTKDKEEAKDDSKKEGSPKKGDDKEVLVNGDKKAENGTKEEAKVNGHSKADEKAVVKGDAKPEEESMEAENGVKDASDTEGTVESEDIADEEGEGEEVEGEEVEGEEAVGEDAGEGTSDGKTKEESEEDVTNLQLAWEVLELSKMIYNRQASKEMKLKAAEAHLKLGEVGMETEQYDQAIEDLQACLKIQMEHLEPESRLIAESHYQLGLACVFSTKYNLALEHLRKAVSVINAKMSKLHGFIEAEGKKEEKDDSAVTNAQKEISDLKEILPDILAKIEDTEDEKNNQEKVKQMVKENVAKSGGSTEESGIKFSEASSSSKDGKKEDGVSDIGHLVRKKRKPEDDAEVADDAKKAKADTNGKETTPVVNGAGDAKKVST